MIKNVIKRNGTVESFSADKVNSMANWAVEVAPSVPWSDIVMEAMRLLNKEEVTAQEIQDSLIKVCIDREDYKHNKIAGRLLLGSIRKASFAADNFKDHYNIMVEDGYYREMNYSDYDLEILSNVISDNKDLDLSYGYPTLRQFIDKYAVKDKDGNLLELPQYMYMAVAMSLFENGSLEDVIIYYNKASSQKINIPSPVLAQQRTNSNTGVSCVISTAGDSLGGIEATKHVAFMSTASSAGLGIEYDVRSPKDTVRNGYAKAGGKLPHYRVLDKITDEVKQSNRGGSATVSFNVIDPEVETLLNLKLKRSPETKKIDQLDYSLVWNNEFLKSAATRQDWKLFSKKVCPEAHYAFYNGGTTQDNIGESKTVNALNILKQFSNNRLETGRLYWTNIDNVNEHTPWKDSIRLSNLCVAPETQILTRSGYIPIAELEGKFLDIWNGFEWSNVNILKTGTNQEMIAVCVATYEDGKFIGNNELVSTTYHKWYGEEGDEYRTFQLKEGMWLLPHYKPNGTLVTHYVVSLNGHDNTDTYCFTEPKRNLGMFNGICTGQCQEVLLPTKEYESLFDLGKTTYEEGDGITAQCFLSAIDLARISDDKDYEETSYIVLKSLDNLINNMSYPLPQMEATAKYFRSVGVGLTNLAYHLAKSKHKFNDVEYLHYLAERHYYYLMKASVRLAKERGCFDHYSKTKWADGWTPLSTYKRAVDTIVDPDKLYYDWDTLKSYSLKYGVRFSTLVAHMPCESSSVMGNGTNGLYPIRHKVVYKDSKGGLVQFFAPEVDELEYENAYDVNPYTLINSYAIFQKFNDQGISADTYEDLSKGSGKVSTTELIKKILYANKMGMKTWYYNNTKTGRGEDKTILVDEGSDCCKL